MPLLFGYMSILAWVFRVGFTAIYVFTSKSDTLVSLFLSPVAPQPVPAFTRDGPCMWSTIQIAKHTHAEGTRKRGGGGRGRRSEMVQRQAQALT